MGRPKKNPDYNPERARDELVKAVSDFYLNPPKEDFKGKDGKTRMKNMELEFGLSMGKIRKLLVTGGVYSFEKDGVDLVEQIAGLREEGLSDNEIMEKLSIKKSLLNALTPYQRGTYNADFTADGYDISNVSTEARRKRNQRKRDKMKETNVVEDHEKEIEEAKRQMDEKKYPGMTPEQIEEEKARRRAENEARHQANLEKKRKYRERRAMEDNTPEPPKPQPAKPPVTSDAILELIEKNDKTLDHLKQMLEMKKAEEQQEKSRIEKIDEYTYAPAIDEEEDDDELYKRLVEFLSRQEEVVLPEIDEETLGTRWPSKKKVRGRPVGDFLFAPDTSHAFLLPNGKTVKVDEGGAIGVFDANHEKHIFVFEIMGPTVDYIFKAIEVKKLKKNGKVMAGQPDTEYEFTVMGKLEDQEACCARLIDKVIISLQNLSIHRSGRTKLGIDSPDQYLTDKYVLAVNETGLAMVEYDGIRIDGHLYSPEDAFKLLCPYEGSELHFALRDSSDSEPFTNDTVLYPVEMNIDTFVDELAKIMMVVSDKHEGKFIKKEDVPYLDILMGDLLKKLNFYFMNENRQEATEIAEGLIDILNKIGTDSPVFPVYQIKLIRDAVTVPWKKTGEEL